MSALLVTDTEGVLREGRPLIDLRSPGEFAHGAVPSAVNLPLLTDAERAAVGTTYRHAGQAAAIALGESLVSEEVRRERLASWLRFVDATPGAMLYCWRGGLRSERVQSWLADAGRVVPRIAGGFKALRRTCIEAIERAAAGTPLLVLGGRTGSGKTALLREFEAAIDLEHLANHRGSAFGATLRPQPTPVAFENALAVELLRRSRAPCVLIEDESRTIGHLGLPQSLFAAMQRAPLVVLEVTLAERARRIAQEYVCEPLAQGVGRDALRERYLAASDRIRRRLGGDRHVVIRAAIDAAFASGSSDAHVDWIALLLEWYYDPMYEYQLERKHARVVFRGAWSDVRDALRARLLVRTIHEGT
jgi:tRNA 2-selenouridine synthase